jgi:hypothetical protein
MNEAYTKLLSSGTVVNGAHWAVLKSEEEFARLAEVTNAPKGRIHAPIQHFDAMKCFEDKIAQSGIKIGDRVGMLSPNTEKFVYTMDVLNDEFDDFTFQLGFINFNNRTMSARIIASDKCFICSNNVFRGLTTEKQRHVGDSIGGFATIIDDGIEDFMRYKDKRVAQIELFKNTEVNDDILSRLLLDMHRSRIFGADPGLIGRIFDEFDSQHGAEPRHDEFTAHSMWSFQNCATEQLKSVNPAKRMLTDSALIEIATPYCK